jgi:hypothetical protein
MTTISFNYKEHFHPIRVQQVEEGGRTYYEVDFIKNVEKVQEIISLNGPLRFDEKGYGPKAKSMAGINLLISMWKTIDKHFNLAS